MSEFHYKAFISYSHSDERWASWLHRKLETYTVPSRLRKQPGGHGPLRPIFRDREELAAASNLSETITRALDCSEALIVICSPAAAQSRWVNEEIRHFRQSGRGDRIYCVIVESTPGGSGEADPCFPPALLEGNGADNEPLACDLRPWADGKSLGLLKLLASLLGIPLDQLRRRHHQRRLRRRVLATVGVIAALAIILAAVTSRQAAQQRRDSGESLVEMKLNELRNVIDPEADPEDLVDLKEWSESDLATLAAGAGQISLVDHAMALRERGINEWQALRFRGAVEWFRQSFAILAMAYRNDRSQADIFFELGQAEYWVGHAYLDIGDLDKAEHAFTQYALITRSLVERSPENSDWVLEMAYALTNLGAVQQARETGDPERTLQLMQSALEYNQIALVLDPGDNFYRAELGQSFANLADAQLGVCDLAGALASRIDNVTLERNLLDDEPGDTERMIRLAFALGGLAKVYEFQGDYETTERHLRESLNLSVQVLDALPGNQESLLLQLNRRQRIAWAQAMRGDIETAWQASNALLHPWQEETESGFSLGVIGTSDHIAFLSIHSWLAYQTGRLEVAREFSMQALQELISAPGGREKVNLLIRSAYRAWQMKAHASGIEYSQWLPAGDEDLRKLQACEDAGEAFKLAVMRGEDERAADLAKYLTEQKYAEAEFQKLCATTGFCAAR